MRPNYRGVLGARVDLHRQLPLSFFLSDFVSQSVACGHKFLTTVRLAGENTRVIMAHRENLYGHLWGI